MNRAIPEVVLCSVGLVGATRGEPSIQPACGRPLRFGFTTETQRAQRLTENGKGYAVRPVVYEPDAVHGAPPLEVWRYEKRLR